MYSQAQEIYMTDVLTPQFSQQAAVENALDAGTSASFQKLLDDQQQDTLTFLRQSKTAKLHAHKVAAIHNNDIILTSEVGTQLKDLTASMQVRNKNKRS